MKKRYISLILTITIILSCTISVQGYWGKYKSYDSEISYEEFINHNDNMTSDFGNDVILGIIYRKYNIPMDTAIYNVIANNYCTPGYDFVSVNRMTALIDLMRVNFLIPDPDYKSNTIWADIPKDITAQKLAYINYAKDLGITKGIGNNQFGFKNYTNYNQVKAFIEAIDNLNDVNKTESPIKIIDLSKENYNLMAVPLIIEYMNSLPQKVRDRLISSEWDITLVLNGFISNQNAVGLTFSASKGIQVVTERYNQFAPDFLQILIHEFGHAIMLEVDFSFYEENYPQIVEVEMPKLGKEYRDYAMSSMTEYFACAWYWLYYIGEEKFSQEYPETYKAFQECLALYE